MSYKHSSKNITTQRIIQGAETRTESLLPSKAEKTDEIYIVYNR